MTQMKVSKLISDDQIKHHAQSHSMEKLKSRCTGLTLGCTLVVIGEAMKNPETKQYLCSFDNDSYHTVSMFNLATKQMGLKHFEVIKNGNGVFIVYNIYRTINTDNFEPESKVRRNK